MPKVYIIILQFNNSENTLTCLESVKKIDYSNFGIIVVDNNSELEHLNNVRLWIENQKDKLEKLHLIVSETNTGYSGGNNLGIKYAKENGAEFVLILNPDIEVSPDLLTKLINEGMTNENIKIVGCRINEFDRSVGWGKVEWLKSELKLLPDEYEPKNSYITGACMLIKSKLFDKIGYFDERYFLYFEDADFCVRARKAGFRFSLVNQPLVSHLVSSSTNKLGSPVILYYHYRNSLLFNYLNGNIFIKLLLPFWSFWVIFKQLIKYVIFPRKRLYARQIITGVIDFYSAKFGIN